MSVVEWAPIDDRVTDSISQSRLYHDPTGPGTEGKSFKLNPLRDNTCDGPDYQAGFAPESPGRRCACHRRCSGSPAAAATSQAHRRSD